MYIFLPFLEDNGGYSPWSVWTHCSVTCGIGHHSRSRSCTNPPPGRYGDDCSEVGSNIQTAECNSGKECLLTQLKNHNQTAECNNTSCVGIYPNNNSFDMFSICCSLIAASVRDLAQTLSVCRPVYSYDSYACMDPRQDKFSF